MLSEFVQSSPLRDSSSLAKENFAVFVALTKQGHFFSVDSILSDEEFAVFGAFTRAVLPPQNSRIDDDEGSRAFFATLTNKINLKHFFRI